MTITLNQEIKNTIDINRKIAELESPVSERRKREAELTEDGKTWLTDHLTDVENQIVELRKQL